MAEALYLVSKADKQNGVMLIDDIVACIINSDDAGTDADKIADAVAQAVAAGHPLPTGYFDTVEDIGDLATGKLSTDLDTVLFTRRGMTENIT
jgi:hypothetical protein